VGVTLLQLRSNLRAGYKSRDGLMKIAPLVGLALLATHANAFNVWGFRSGMSEDQTIAVARGQGYEAHVPGVLSTPRFHNLSFTQKGTYELVIATFCDGHVIGLGHEYKASYGEPVVHTSSTVITEGRARTMKFNFHPKPDDLVSIDVNINMQDEKDFTIQVFHEIAEMKCAGPAL
jgi:hypothetical protein